MVNIKLDDSWSLTSDSRQWILNFDERGMTFHTKLEYALETYLEKKIRGSNTRTFNGLVQYHKVCLHNLQQALTPLKIEIDVKKMPVFEEDKND